MHFNTHASIGVIKSQSRDVAIRFSNAKNVVSHQTLGQGADLPEQGGMSHADAIPPIAAMTSESEMQMAGVVLEKEASKQQKVAVATTPPLTWDQEEDTTCVGQMQTENSDIRFSDVPGTEDADSELHIVPRPRASKIGRVSQVGQEAADDDEVRSRLADAMDSADSARRLSNIALLGLAHNDGVEAVATHELEVLHNPVLAAADSVVGDGVCWEVPAVSRASGDTQYLRRKRIGWICRAPLQS